MVWFAVEQARKSRIHEENFIDRENHRQSLFGSTSSPYFDDISSLVAETPSLLEFDEPVPLTSTISTPNHNSKSINKSQRSARINKINDPILNVAQPSTSTNDSMVPPIETMPPVDAPSNGDVPMV